MASQTDPLSLARAVSENCLERQGKVVQCDVCMARLRSLRQR